jgi:hypothetical protein
VYQANGSTTSLLDAIRNYFLRPADGEAKARCRRPAHCCRPMRLPSRPGSINAQPCTCLEAVGEGQHVGCRRRWFTAWPCLRHTAKSPTSSARQVGGLRSASAQHRRGRMGLLHVFSRAGR